MGWAALACGALGAFLLLWGVVQAQFGIFDTEKWALPATSKIKQDGKAFKTKLPAWGIGGLAERSIVLQRDGGPVGMKVNHARTVVEHGGGAYKIQREQLYFSLPQDEDPRGNIQAFSVSLPAPVRPAVWIVGTVLLLIGGIGVRKNAHAEAQLATASDRLNAIPAVALVAVVFVFGIVTTLSRLPEAVSYSDGCFSVKGVPYSDATGWDELAMNLAQGQGFKGGFSAQRPLYPTMLGLVYAVTGESLLAAKALNAFWLALAAAAVCALGCACGSRSAGCAGALAVLLGEDYVSFSKLLLTETSGVVFGAASVLVLVLAVGSPRWWLITLAGLLLACASLAGGFALFALLGYGTIALVTWWARLGMKKALGYSVLLAGVVALGWAPWLLRQKAVHGIFNLSANSAPNLYGTATEYGKWSSEVANAWRAEDVPNEEGARYKFYMTKYAEAVKADPGAYTRTVLRGMGTFADSWVFEGPDRVGVVLLGLMAAMVTVLRSRRAWSVLVAAALVVGMGGWLEGRSAMVLWPLAAALVLLTCPRAQRPYWAILAVTAPFVSVLAGMTGGNLGRRMWTACEWTMPLMLVMGGAVAVRLLTGWLEVLFNRLLKVHEPHASAKEDLTTSGATQSQLLRAGLVLGGVLLVHAVVASGFATGLYFFSGEAARSKTSAPASLAVMDRTKVDELASAQFDFLKGQPPSDGRLWAELGQVGEYVCSLDAWEDEQHWGRSFEVRPYARSVVVARLSSNGSLMPCQTVASPQIIPRDVPLLFIGVRNVDPNAHLGHDVTMVELLGFVPVNGTAPDWSRVTWLPATPEASAILQGQLKRP